MSQVEVGAALAEETASPLLPALRVAIESARGAKCVRCWNYREDVGGSAEHPELCGRCTPVVENAA